MLGADCRHRADCARLDLLTVLVLRRLPDISEVIDSVRCYNFSMSDERPGSILIVVGIAMFFIGTATFTAREQPSPLVGAIGGISFLTWWLPILVAGYLLFGPRAKDDD
jgi:hypothetical protein